MPTAIPELQEPAVIHRPPTTIVPDEQSSARAVREKPPALGRPWCVPTDPPPV